MSKYIYPAIFTPEKKGAYSVDFPDLEGCFTSGESLQEAFAMAEDALALMLFHFEQEKRPIPEPSNVNDINKKNNEFVSLIPCDTIGYQKMHNNKAVKKTLTIPEWLNELSVNAGVNFSQVLQDGLIQKLGI